MKSLEFDEQRKAFQEFYLYSGQLLKDAEVFFRGLIASVVASADDIPLQTISARVKDCDECISKFKRKYRSKLEETKTPYEIKEYITDLVGVRIVCLYEADVPRVLQILKANFDVVGITDKTAAIEQTDDSFGYKSIHLDVRLNDARKALPENARFRDFQVEVQVRTLVQDAWSQLDHKIKYKKSIPHELRRRINGLAALFELADHEFLNIHNETVRLEKEGKSTPLTEVVPVPEKILDVFEFLEVAKARFPEFDFRSEAADGFVIEIRSMLPDFAKEDLEAAITAHSATVDKYAEHVYQALGNTMNPFTRLRHILFLSNQAAGKRILFDRQRRGFEAWLKTKEA